ncbi:phage major capsid protein [Mycolicibacterium septicum]|uniref:phage major capsid protein n=1 Tax=Mycolicibacterium septicum TaxID=98668 RepID=UPI0023E1E94F|nr:phage major capsid protein [Mycolicibacterium septicum]MDF3338198.1 phage major capsid protein [Mycolicibacterium septicum]
MTTGFETLLDQLEARRDRTRADAKALLIRAQGQGRDKLTKAEYREFKGHLATAEGLHARCNDIRSEIARMGDGQRPLHGSGTSADEYVARWGNRAVESLKRTMGGAEARAVVSASIDVPSLVEADVTPIPHPARVIDLFSNRVSIESNAFEFYRQSARTNSAAPTADLAEKPTSVNTITPIQDRARVIAHLSEPAPQRLWEDHSALRDWLTTEMREGVLDALEAQVISGSGSGENLTGLLTIAGTNAVAYATDVPTTLRSALTAAQVAGVVPTGWVLHPNDAAAIDLTRWSTGGGFLTGGYENDHKNGFGTSDNIFGVVPRVISPSVPAGTALLGDFSKLRLYVKNDVRIDIDVSGEHFTHNTFVMRAEGRFGLGILRPASFFKIDLTA